LCLGFKCLPLQLHGCRYNGRLTVVQRTEKASVRQPRHRAKKSA
jgi:hypothetical protein